MVVLEKDPQQTQSLAGLWWPLVLSTNYDNCYPAAFQDHFGDRQLAQLAVVGRSVEDCQRVLNSLSVAGRPLLWALQGYLDAPHVLPTSKGTSPLRQQLVVGHEEYRRVTYRDLHFRRAFAEVFRQRSLLFLGAGIQETYMQQLFGEVLEYYGPSTRPHYAFIQEGEVDPEFMLARFQIIAVEYPKAHHELVVQQLDELAKGVASPRRAPVSWSWGRIIRREGNDWTSAPNLEVVRGPLPTERVEGECLAVSAGGSGSSFFFSGGIRRLMTKWGVGRPIPMQISEYLGEYPAQHVFAVRARSPEDERSLAHVYDASLDLFERAALRYRCIRMQLLATGGVDKLGSARARWKVRTYPERFSFIQTVRAWGAWREQHPEIDCRLALHVVLEAVYYEIASGRIDVLELLSCRDVRFFVEVVSDGGNIERRLFQMMPDTTLGAIVRQLQLSPAHWTLEVTPPPKSRGPAPRFAARAREPDAAVDRRRSGKHAALSPHSADHHPCLVPQPSWALLLQKHCRA